MISVIAAIGLKNEIGSNNGLLWDLPEDMALFKRLTTGCAVIMGRKTLDSIGKPLTNRMNIVITNDKKFTKKDVYVVHSFSSALKLAKKLGTEDVFIIGGGEIYKQALENDQVEKMYITHVQKDFKNADTFFPKISSKKWKKIKEEEKKTKSGVPIVFAQYQKIK